MQKVSKQSLAMIALSILLAISIALTFTFAALSASKTATGTITFNKAYGLTLNSNADTYTFKVNFTSNDQTNAVAVATKGDSETTEWNDATIGIASTSSACNIQVRIEFNVTGDDAGAEAIKTALAKYIEVPAEAISDVEVGGTKKLNTIINFKQLSLENADFATLTNTSATAMTATVTFTAVSK